MVEVEVKTREEQIIYQENCYERWKRKCFFFQKKMILKKHEYNYEYAKAKEQEEERIRTMLILQMMKNKVKRALNSVKEEVVEEIKNNVNEVRESEKANKKQVPVNDDEDEDTLRAKLLTQIRNKIPTDLKSVKDERSKCSEDDEFVLEVFIRKEDLDFIEKDDSTEVAIKSEKYDTQIKKPELSMSNQKRDSKSQYKVRTRRSPSPRRGDYKRRRHDLEKKPELRTQPRDTKSQYRVRSKRSRSPSPRRGDYKRRRPLETESERRDRERRERRERDRRYKLRSGDWRSQGY